MVHARPIEPIVGWINGNRVPHHIVSEPHVIFREVIVDFDACRQFADPTVRIIALPGRKAFRHVMVEF